jgi:hypothetical protein
MIPISLTSILILGFPKGTFPSCEPVNILKALLPSLLESLTKMLFTFDAIHKNLVDFIQEAHAYLNLKGARVGNGSFSMRNSIICVVLLM